MRKWLFILLLCVLPVLSCTRETEPVQEPLQEDGAPMGKVRIPFSVSLPESSPDTKALGEEPALTSLYLAVFGSSGHYKEYVEATMEAGYPKKENRTFIGEDENHNPVTFTREVDVYKFSAQIELSNSPRTIHFLGNGPSPSSITIGDASAILPNLLCNSDENGTKETAFWQMIYLPEIKAATNEDGQFLNPLGGIRQPHEDYMVDPETLAYFTNKADLDSEGNVQGGIALIRNWAKIVIRNNWENGVSVSNFEPYSFAVVNVPKRGTFVPYGGKTGFFGPDKRNPNRKFFNELGFDELNDENGDYAYPGNLPEGTEFNHTSPTDADFVGYNTAKGVVKYEKKYDPGANDPDYHADQSEKEPAVYLYERPAPSSSMEPSYVIIYGKYYNPDDPSLTPEEIAAGGVMCYYKVDLMANGKYYPIYRNFKYQIQIRKISSRGHDTPEEAAASAGSADVSADVTASHLADISDGTRRMAIRPWMSYTFIEGDREVDDNGDPLPLQDHLYVKFYDNITVATPTPNMDPASVSYELIPSGDGVIKDGLVEIDNPVDGDGYTNEEKGWRSIRFRVNHPGDVSVTQTLRIKCKTNPNASDDEEAPLYRDIVLTLQPIQPMKVACEYPRVPRYTKENQYVNISIPDGLVESMFPLVFIIEPQNMTLTPLNDQGNLPVVYGKSINPNEPDKPRFQFKRTLTWEDYKNLSTTVVFEDESRWKTFTSHFQTNCENSATDIWVADEKEYFRPVKCSFTDFSSFKDPAFTTSIPKSTDGSVGVTFGVKEENGAYPDVYVQLTNLTWTGTAPAYDEARQAYKVNPDQETVTLALQTTGTTGDVSVKLFTEDDSYEPVTLEPWHFTNVGFVETHALPSSPTNRWGSNAVFGMVNNAGGKNVLFGFCTDAGTDDKPGKLTPKIDFIKEGLTFNNNNTLDLSKSTQHNGAYSGKNNYYWAEMQSVKGTTDASVTLRSVGYVEETVTAGRFNGEMQSNLAPASTLKSWFGSSASKTGIDMHSEANKRYAYASLEFNPQPLTSNNGVILEKGKTYTMTVHFYKSITSGVEVPTTCELTSVQLQYLLDGVPQSHLSYEIKAPQESTFYQYLGNNAEYIWTFPRGCQTGTIELKAPNNRDAVINALRIWGFMDLSN